MELLPTIHESAAYNKGEWRNRPVDELLDELDKMHALCNKLNQIIEWVPDGIYVTDGEANAIRINPAFERISGLDRDNMLGVNHKELEKTHVVSRSSSLMVVKQKRPVTIIHEYLPTNRQALVTSIPIFDERGDISLIVSSTRDLTELNDLKDKLASEKETRLKYERQIEMLQSQLLNSQEMIAVDKKSLDTLSSAARVALVDSSVLITGETGVGKEELAKYIHKNGPRKNGPFVTINCGAIPESLVESELFGYDKGAFTGAKQDGKLGLLEMADGGTLFLDEIGELPLEIQVKLLRALESRTIMHIGGSNPIPFDARIVSATNKDLAELVDRNLFREDLYYRLNVVPIHIAPLREREDDIVPLVNHYLVQINKKYEYNKTLSQMAYRILLHYRWPGNVRELKNLIERVVVMSDSDTIAAEDLPMYDKTIWSVDDLGESYSLKERLEQIEYSCMRDALAKHNSIRKAAASLRMTVPTFIRKRDLYQEKYVLQK